MTKASLFSYCKFEKSALNSIIDKKYIINITNNSYIFLIKENNLIFIDFFIIKMIYKF